MGTLLPEFTIRNLLLITLACGGFFAILASAVKGEAWAVGLAGPFVIVAGTLLIQMLCYLLAFFLGRLRPDNRPEVSNPFADTTPSEQVVTPQEREW